MCTRQAMADEPVKDNIKPLPELNEKNAYRVSIEQTFLILYWQRLQALFELFNAEIQKLKQSTTRIFEIFFWRSKYRGPASLKPIASHLFWLSTEEDMSILRGNVKKLNNTMNVSLHDHKIQASIANHQRDKVEAISNKISKTLNVMNYLKKK
jgi:hypothetical protein